MAPELRRRTPEELLRAVQAEEAEVRRGRLKVFLGYASGVGKSARMFDEARRRRERGQDVLIGATQPMQTMDLEAILRRHPAVCVIDGLAYGNPPGSKNPARWQDVRDLLDAGISVITSINVQYVEELRDEVGAITGKHVRDVVPESFLKNADEIEVVDAPADHPTDSARLSKLREIALVLAADVVDHQLTDYLQRHGIDQNYGTHERLMICITPRSNLSRMLESGSVVAARFHAELIVAYVRQEQIAPADQQALDSRIEQARSAGASIEMLEGDDPVEAILEFAESRGITQLFIGHSQRRGLWPRLWGNPVEKLIRRSRGMDIRVFPQ